MLPKILRTDAELEILEPRLHKLAGIAEVVTTPHYDEAGLMETARDAALILTCYAEITAKVIEAAAGLKGIVKYGVGVNSIDIDTATRRGIMVANCPRYGTETVAEHAFCLLIALARKLPKLQRLMREEAWVWPEAEHRGNDMSGKTLGLIGYGHIGRAMGRQARGFGMQLLVCDPYVSPESAAADDVSFCSLDDLLEGADYISVHCILTPETRGLLGEAEFRRMKDTAYLVNVSRGPIIDEAALIGALKENRIAGAGFDVYDQEPLTSDYPLFGMDNVILTPHLAWYTEEAFERCEDQTLESVLDILAGKRPRNLKNTELFDQ